MNFAERPVEVERRRMALLAKLPLRRTARAPRREGRHEDLMVTPRQRQVLDGLVRGLANKEIAAELGVGPDAVKRTVSRLMAKLNAPSRTALVQAALRTAAAREDRARVPNALKILDAAPIPVLVTRGEGHLLEYVNPTARGVLSRWDTAASLGEMLPEPARTDVLCLVDDVFRNGDSRVAPGVPLATGMERREWRAADIHASPLQDGANEVAGVIVFLVDASARLEDQPVPARIRQVTRW